MQLALAPTDSFDVAAFFANLDKDIDDGKAYDEIPPYDADIEELPRSKVPALQSKFAEAEALITQKVVQFLLNAICRVRSTKPSSALQHMEERTRRRVAPSYRPPVIIGARGLAGVGKTSLVSGLLHIDNLARTVSVVRLYPHIIGIDF